MDLNEKLAARRKELAAEANKTKKEEQKTMFAEINRHLAEKGIDKPLIRIMAGLFVGICSGFAIVAILEEIAGFYGLFSSILTILFVFFTVKYSLKKEIQTIKTLDKLLTANSIVFIIAIMCSIMFTVSDMSSHKLLVDMSLINKMLHNSELTFKIGMPGYISVLLLFILDKKIGYFVDISEAQIPNNKKRNFIFVAIYSCLVFLLIIGQLFITQKPLTLNNMAQMGWQHIDGETYANYGSIKKSSVDTVTFEIAEADQFMVNQHMYEINCKDKKYRSLDWVSWIDSGVVTRFVRPIWEQIGPYVEPTQATVMNEVCMRSSNTSIYNISSIVYKNSSTAFNNNTTAFRNSSTSKTVTK